MVWTSESSSPTLKKHQYDYIPEESKTKLKVVTMETQRLIGVLRLRGYNNCKLPVAYNQPLSIQVCPKKGINPTILLWGWDWDHQSNLL